MPPQHDEGVSVIYVEPQNAKRVKNVLEKHHHLDKRFRMTPKVFTNQLKEEQKLIAVPIVDVGLQCIFQAKSKQSNTLISSLSSPSPSPGFQNVLSRINIINSNDEVIKTNQEEDNEWINLIHSVGFQICPFSTAILGNHHMTPVICNDQIDMKTEKQNNNIAFISELSSTLSTAVQKALLKTVILYTTNQMDTESKSCLFNDDRIFSIVKSIKHLPLKVCPKKLEHLGNDTLVIPPKALSSTESTFQSFLQQQYNKFIYHSTLEVEQYQKYQQKSFNKKDEATKNDFIHAFMSTLWENLAHFHNQNKKHKRQYHRIVRKGEIDPNSKVRKSGHVILWISPNYSHDSLSSSPGWITITEQGIHQSFDMTKVMFSRGNVTEKIRFGETLVQPDDVVLDMYAGIGYYTLPALLSCRSVSGNRDFKHNSKVSKQNRKCSTGKARFVYACEWNEDAIHALEYNLQQNGISPNRYVILKGDCRIVLKQMLRNQWGIFDNDASHLPNMKTNKKDGDDEEYHKNRGAGVDRISLGLLPSSEGGWYIALQCLRKNRGGWLHVHGNVPTSEKLQWTMWVCRRLMVCVDEIKQDEKKEHQWKSQYEEEQHLKENMEQDNNECARNKMNSNHHNWYVICNHVERVKSFAPRVDHLVADIFVGPLDNFLGKSILSSSTSKEKVVTLLEQSNNRVGMMDTDRNFNLCPSDIDPPSCALNRTGILHQEWMMNNDN